MSLNVLLISFLLLPVPFKHKSRWRLFKEQHIPIRLWDRKEPECLTTKFRIPSSNFLNLHLHFYHIYSEFSGKREINVKNGSLLRVVGACSSIVIRTVRIRGLVVFGSTGSGGVDIGKSMSFPVIEVVGRSFALGTWFRTSETYFRINLFYSIQHPPGQATILNDRRYYVNW